MSNMVTHTRLQHYKHHYGMVFLTGLLGCRWHRYQQSTEKTNKIDLWWFSFLILSSAFILLWFYFWLIAENSFDDINWFTFKHLGSFVPAYTICLVLTCVSMAYIAILVILALCHVGHGHQVYMHHVHKALLVITVLGCVGMAVAITDLWGEGWHLQLHSLMITGPFLHVAAVAVLTFLSWFIASSTLEIQSKGCQVVCFAMYFTFLLGLYVAPLFMDSPCIGKIETLTAKPGVVAHRGASAVAPENTLISFEYATHYDSITLETDISISYDGVPFLMHDTTLRRTTNVDDVFPSRAHLPACMFNISDLKQLSAGSQFLENDPQGTVSGLSDAQKDLYRNQTIPTLAELLHLAIETNRNVIFDIKFLDDIKDGIVKDHPYNKTFGDVIINTILDSRIEQKKIWWLFNDMFNTSHNFTRVDGLSQMPNDMDEYMRERSVEMINMGYSGATWTAITTFHEYNLSTNVYVINSPWLFSLYWCMGTDSVTSNHCDRLKDITRPVWHMTPTEFLIMWVVTDVLSAVLVVTIFIIQGLRRSKKFKEEALTIQNARMKVAHRKQKHAMKVKLIHAAEGMTEDVDHGVTASPGVIGTEDTLATSVGGGDGGGGGGGYLSLPGDSASVSGESMTSSHHTPGTHGANRLSAGLSSVTSDVATTDSSLNRTLSEDEVRGIRLAEITVDKKDDARAG